MSAIEINPQPDSVGAWISWFAWIPVWLYIVAPHGMAAGDLPAECAAFTASHPAITPTSPTNIPVRRANPEPYFPAPAIEWHIGGIFGAIHGARIFAARDPHRGGHDVIASRGACRNEGGMPYFHTSGTETGARAFLYGV